MQGAVANPFTAHANRLLFVETNDIAYCDTHYIYGENHFTCVFPNLFDSIYGNVKPYYMHSRSDYKHIEHVKTQDKTLNSV